MEILNAFQHVLSPYPLMWIIVGVAGGIFVGAIPGLGGGMLMALTVPLTFSMDSTNAVLLLMGMHVGSVSGGLISYLAQNARNPLRDDDHIRWLSSCSTRTAGQGPQPWYWSLLFGGIVSGIFLIALAPLSRI